MGKNPPNAILASSLLVGSILILVIGIGIFFNFYDIGLSSVMRTLVGGVILAGSVFSFVMGIVLIVKVRKFVKINPSYYQSGSARNSLVKMFTVFLVLGIVALIITLGGMLITGGILKDFSQFLIPIIAGIIAIAYYRHHLKSKEKLNSGNPQQNLLEG